MTFVDDSQTDAVKLARQARIIEALVRRATRDEAVKISAYEAFQSTIKLQEQVAAQTRDLEIAADTLQALRFDQEKTRHSLNDALASMEDGFGLFVSGQLLICNDLFRTLVTDIAKTIRPGLEIGTYLQAVAASRTLKSLSKPFDINGLRAGGSLPSSEFPMQTYVLEFANDRWFQLRVQRTQQDRAVILISDISSIVRQNRTEKESLIDAQANYLQAAFENMRSGVCTFSEKGDVIMFNGPFRELLGLPFTVLRQGASISRILEFMRQNQTVPRRAMLRLRDLFSALDTEGGFSYRFSQAEQRVLDLQANSLPDGGFLIELKDVTIEMQAKTTLERRVKERTSELTYANARLTAQYEAQARVEEELRLAKEQAEAAVSSKTRFLAAASHDLLQPVNAAKLTINLLEQDTRGGPSEAHVDRLKRAFESTEQILHALLDISRLDGATPGTIRKNPVNLGSIMRRIFEDQRPLADQKGVALRYVPCSALVVTDPTYLLRSLQNMVVNAIQYNRSGGRVLIGARRRGDTVQLLVIDDGPGIAPADQQRIFDEFARGTSAGQVGGLGLGLSVVERACRQLGHKLWLRSEPGRGARFCIELSATWQLAALPSLRSSAKPGQSLPPGVIALVLENDSDVLSATVETLDRWGVSALAAQNSAEAFKLVADIGIPPDIILADYQLDDGTTGLETIARLRLHAGARIPAILITANRNDALFDLCGAQQVGVLIKPVDLSRLRVLMESKLRKLAQPRLDGPTESMATIDLDQSLK